MKRLLLENFKYEEDMNWFHYPAVTLWGAAIDFSVEFWDEEEETEEILTKVLPKLQKKLEWLDENKASLAEALIEFGYLEAAEIWVLKR